jgi:uncharacterized Zn-binding protein involved in type VI secretion
MPEAATLGALHSGVGIIPPSPAAQGSPDVKIEGKAALRVGDAFADGNSVSSGAPHVFINGKAAARMGDQVSNGASIVQGAASVKIGDKGGAGFNLQAARFTALCGMLEANPAATGKDKLLMCIPRIADAMATKAESANEAQGWVYLHDAIIKWLSGPVNRDAQSGGEPFWIDWDWVMGLKRYQPVPVVSGAVLETSPKNEYEKFIAPFEVETIPNEVGDPIFLPEPYQNINNSASKMDLSRILVRDGGLGSKKLPFDHIAAPWTQWEAKYHTLHKVSQPYGVNAQQALLGGFTLRALAKGWTEPEGRKHRIHITDVAVFAHDVFNFDPAGVEWLGCWNCEKGDVVASIGDYLLGPPSGYTVILNEDFRNYQNKYGLGHDYLVLSQPHLVENFEAISYVYSL